MLACFPSMLEMVSNTLAKQAFGAGKRVCINPQFLSQFIFTVYFPVYLNGTHLINEGLSIDCIHYWVVLNLYIEKAAHCVFSHRHLCHKDMVQHSSQDKNACGQESHTQRYSVLLTVEKLEKMAEMINQLSQLLLIDFLMIESLIIRLFQL